MISSLSWLTGEVYRRAGKPLLFLVRADYVHAGMLALGEFFGKTPLPKILAPVYRYQNPILSQTIDGIQFQEPVGLAAGFDYNVSLPQFVYAFGMGWNTVGTVTYGYYAGNTPPMLGRLPKSRSLWVNKGFKSDGAAAVKKKIASLQPPVPLGISIGATNRLYTTQEDQILEYVKAFQELGNDLPNTYWELNISCPNLATKNDFQNPTSLYELVKAVEALKLTKPVYLKMPIDLETPDFMALLKVVKKSGLAGIIIGNLTKKASPKQFWMQERQNYTKGGFSGLPTQERSDYLIGVAYQYFRGAKTIIGCGGIFNAQDAYRKIRNGANVLQLITGLIYEGPQLPGQIHCDLATLLKRDGYSHISQTVGVEYPDLKEF